MNTTHLIIDTAGNLKLRFSDLRVERIEPGSVVLKNGSIQVSMAKEEGLTVATINGEPVIVSKYHVAYNLYPLIRRALR